MDNIKSFFLRLGFDFKDGLKSRDYPFSENKELYNKLKKNFYYYKSPNQTNTTFYLISTVLSEEEINEVRNYVWNQNQADLIFIVSSSSKGNTLFNEVEQKLHLYYAKGNPKIKFKEYLIDSFSPSKEDSETIDKIKKWQFDSGLFWLNYERFLKKIENSKAIDRVLVDTLYAVKEQLYAETKDEEIVQALIDRTLYIKYLEDNHIINSYFYNHYFGNSDLVYKTLLKKQNIKQLNQLFNIIHQIFNNSLFDNPKIESKYLTKSVCDLLYHSISGTNFKNQQLSLFDFKFNVIPIEFISYIYEIFLNKEQKDNGIYYTPKKLAQLIVDDVIIDNKIGRVLDPSCGSGMFLIVAYQKLLENREHKLFSDIDKEISFRIKLLADNIFGIEKQLVAQRFTIFSLSLQIFRDLDPEKIKNYIAKQLEEKGKVDLFSSYDFSKNILWQNSLDTGIVPFNGFSFDYIVGNPPFFEIKQQHDEISFLDKYEVKTEKGLVKANIIVGKHQISQCFFLKIKDWSSDSTRFGFVSNSSNFYNDNSTEFQNFFYENYGIEKIYELSKVKKILFEKAKESVVSLIFDNKSNPKTVIEYYSVEMGLFSEKPFELLIIQTDKAIPLNQSDLLNNKIRLRDFLVGNEEDRSLLNSIGNHNILNTYLKVLDGTNDTVNNGLQIVGKEQLISEFNISESKWNGLTKTERNALSDKFKAKYTSVIKSRTFSTPLIQPRNIVPYRITDVNVYLGDISNFQRTRVEKIYSTPRILINRIGKDLKAVYTRDKFYYNFDIYAAFLKDEGLSYLITAIINSYVVNYFVDLFHRKRAGGSFPKIGYDAIKLIPIPNELDEELVNKISKISKELTDGKLDYTDKVEYKLNELIFDLYDLSYWDKQRIRDFFIVDKKVPITKKEENLYKSTLVDSISMYFKNPINVEFYKGYFNLVVAKVYLNDNDIDSSTAKQTSLYILNEIFSQNSSENFLALREIIFGNNCVYIIKKNEKNNWSETKAFEDGQNILKRLGE